jgi:hypothetical protein
MLLNIVSITMSDNVFPISGIGEKRHGDESSCAGFALRLLPVRRDARWSDAEFETRGSRRSAKESEP